MTTSEKVLNQQLHSVVSVDRTRKLASAVVRDYEARARPLGGTLLERQPSLFGEVVKLQKYQLASL